jgi:phosphate-selective porin OprO/OprP
VGGSLSSRLSRADLIGQEHRQARRKPRKVNVGTTEDYELLSKIFKFRKVRKPVILRLIGSNCEYRNSDKFLSIVACVLSIQLLHLPKLHKFACQHRDRHHCSKLPAPGERFASALKRECEMSKRISVFVTVALASLLSSGQAFAQAGPDDETAPSTTTNRSSRTIRAEATEDGMPEKPVRRRLFGSNTATKSGNKPTSNSKAVKPAPAETQAEVLSGPGLITVSPETNRRTGTAAKATISDATETVGRRSGRPAASEPLSSAPFNIAETDGAEVQRPQPGNELYQLTQYQVDEQGDVIPGGGGMSLEEQLADLRARLDRLDTPLKDPNPSDPIAPIPPPAAAAIPSTVQGSVFADPKGASGSYGNDGLTFVSKNGDFKTHFGGVAQLDIIGFGGGLKGIAVPGGAGTQPSVEFRRLRMRADGTMYNYIDWVMEFDFALSLQNVDQANAAAKATGLRSFPTGTGVQGGNTINVIQPTTIFLTFKEIPIFQNVRVGNQQDWFSLEHIESARFQDFMERSPLMDAYAGANNNGYAPGISTFGNTEDQRAGFQMGAYKNNVYDSGFTYSIGDAWTYGARGIWTPYYDEESKGRYLLHTGLGAEYRTFVTNVNGTTGFDNIRVRSRGDLRNAASTLDPNYADTGNFYAQSQFLFNPEIAFQWGPLLVQSEFIASNFYGAKPAKNVAANLGTVYTQGGYVETLYFLTGENRVYNRQQGVFGRVVPKENWDPCKGTWGAWQVGARYDWLDLNKPGTAFQGGNSQDVTFGLNWFLNPNARFQVNYVVSWVNNTAGVSFPGTTGALNGSKFTGDGTIQSFGGRMDFNF